MDKLKILIVENDNEYQMSDNSLSNALSGGNSDQILAKNSSEDFDYHWIDFNNTKEYIFNSSTTGGNITINLDNKTVQFLYESYMSHTPIFLKYLTNQYLQLRYIMPAATTNKFHLIFNGITYQPNGTIPYYTQILCTNIVNTATSFNGTISNLRIGAISTSYDIETGHLTIGGIS